MVTAEIRSAFARRSRRVSLSKNNFSYFFPSFSPICKFRRLHADEVQVSADLHLPEIDCGFLQIYEKFEGAEVRVIYKNICGI